MSDTFAHKLKSVLEGDNLTKLANELYIPTSVLHDWCKGSRRPSMKNLKLVKRLSDYIGLNFEELVLGESYIEEKTLTTVTFSDGGNYYSFAVFMLSGGALGSLNELRVRNSYVVNIIN